MSDVSTPDDEALSALLDGALPEPDAHLLRERLAREPALRARWAELEAANAAVRNAYSGVAAEPLPPRVVELLGGTRAALTVVELRPKSARRFSFAALAAAASIALAVGVVVGVAIDVRAPPDAAELVAAGSIPSGSALHGVLETVPSAATVALDDAVAAMPRLTFATADGRYCREVLMSSERALTDVLACRGEDAWVLEAVSSARSAGGRELYRPVGDAPTAVGAAIDALIAGEPFGADAEGQLIERRWAVEPR